MSSVCSLGVLILAVGIGCGSASNTTGGAGSGMTTGAAGSGTTTGGAGTSGVAGTTGVAGSGLSTGAAGTTGSGGASDLPTLRIYSDTSSVEFTPVLYAARNLYQGTATVRTGGIPNLFNTGANQADLASNAETQALIRSVANPSLRIICTATETYYRVLARRATVPTLADLAGKRITTIAGTSANFYVYKALMAAGIAENQVTIVSASLSAMPRMISSGQVDAITIWEPAMQEAANMLGADGIDFENRQLYREVVNLNTTAEALADPVRRRGIVAFVRALIAAAEIYRTRPAEVRPFIAEAMGVEESLVEQFWAHENFPGKLAPDLLDILVDEEAWLAGRDNRTARTRTQLATLIDASVLAEAMAGP